MSRKVGPLAANSKSMMLMLDRRSALSKLRSAFAGLVFIKSLVLGDRALIQQAEEQHT
jgi:hypothetical protein